MDDTQVRHRRQEPTDEDEEPTPSPPPEGESSGFAMPKLVLSIAWVTLMICVFGYYGSPLDTVEFELPPTVRVEDHWKIDNALEKGERIIPGLAGPESMEVDKTGNLYTGLLDGSIIKVHPSATGAVGEGLVETVRNGPIPGIEAIDGHVQPRPLGIRLHDDKTLYVVDAYYGLYSLNLATKKARSLVTPNGVKPSMKFPNDLDITKDGKHIYFTDSSDRWNLRDLYHDVIEGSCTGRLFRYTVKTGLITTLASQLCFANGVQLSVDESTVAVCETTRSRVLFFDVKNGHVGPVTTVPGLPDNIRRSKNGGYLVAVPIKRTQVYELIAKLPLLRRIITGIVPAGWAKYLGDTKTGMAVELDANGKIIGVIYDENGSVSSTVSEVYETKDGVLLAGSYKEPFIVKAKRQSKA